MLLLCVVFGANHLILEDKLQDTSLGKTIFSCSQNSLVSHSSCLVSGSCEISHSVSIYLWVFFLLGFGLGGWWNFKDTAFLTSRWNVTVDIMFLWPLQSFHLPFTDVPWTLSAGVVLEMCKDQLSMSTTYHMLSAFWSVAFLCIGLSIAKQSFFVEDESYTYLWIKQ